MSAGRAGSARRADRRDATGGAEAAGEPARTSRPVACVSRRRRTGVTERHGERRPVALRHRPAAGRLSGLRGRGQAGRHVLHPLEPAGRARAPDRHEREHGITAAHRAGGGDRFRPPPSVAGPGGSRRLRQPRGHPAAVYERRPRARTGHSADVGRRVDVDVQRDLHRAEGPQENRRQERRRNPAAVHHRPVGRRGHVEPAAVRRGPGPREALRDGDLRDRAGFDRRSSSSGRGFKEAEFVLRQLSQETGGRAFFPSQLADLANVYGQISDELSSQYTVGYTSRNGRRDGAWRRIVVRVNRPNLTARTKLGYFAPTGK